jgi:hypothetical protein
MPVAAVVAVVTRVDPAVDQDTVRAAVERAGGGRAGRRHLAAALAAHPSLLTSGRSPAPTVVRDLLPALRAAGVTGIVAGVTFTGGALLLQRQPSLVKPKLDIPGVLLVSGFVFCLVYGFSNAAAHGWQAPSIYGFIAAGVALLAAFAAWQGRAAHPLLPPRVVLDRNRGGAYLSMFIAGAGLFGTFFFLTYYLQQTLGYSPLVTGLAFP